MAKICERLIAEVSGERNRLLGEKHSSARITSHVVGPNSDFDAGENLTYPHSHASMAENRTDVPESTVPLMQLCLLDLMILEYTLRRFQGGVVKLNWRLGTISGGTLFASILFW